MAKIINLLKREVREDGVVGLITVISFIAGYPVIKLVDSLS